MGRIYTAVASSTQAVAGDIIQLQCPATSMARLREVSVTQPGTEVDDSTEIRISRFATVGSGGNAITPKPANPGDAASGIIVRAFDTTDASGAEDELWREGISILAGFHKIYQPDSRPAIAPSARIVVKFIGDITSMTLIVSIEFEEID